MWETLEGDWERTSTVEGHATGTGQFVVREAFLLNQLLSHAIASCEEDGSRDALG